MTFLLCFSNVGAQNDQVPPLEQNGRLKAPPGVGPDRQSHAATRDSRLAQELPFTGENLTKH